MWGGSDGPRLGAPGVAPSACSVEPCLGRTPCAGYCVGSGGEGYCKLSPWGCECVSAYDSVGGIAELPNVSRSSGPPYAALASGIAATVLALGASAWFATRRLLGR
jgi:hypothetical protein